MYKKIPSYVLPVFVGLLLGTSLASPSQMTFHFRDRVRFYHPFYGDVSGTVESVGTDGVYLIDTDEHFPNMFMAGKHLHRIKE